MILGSGDALTGAPFPAVHVCSLVVVVVVGVEDAKDD